MGRMDQAIVKGMGPVPVPRRFRSEVHPWLLMTARAPCRACLLPRPAPSARRATHSATFEIVGWRVELSASAGAARLVIVGDGAQYTHLVDPGALAAWAAATTKLLALRAR